MIRIRGDIFQPEFQRIDFKFGRHDIDLRFPGEHVDIGSRGAPCSRRERVCAGSAAKHHTAIGTLKVVGDIVKLLGSARPCIINVVIPETNLSCAINAGFDPHDRSRAKRVVEKLFHASCKKPAPACRLFWQGGLLEPPGERCSCRRIRRRQTE